MGGWTQVVMGIGVWVDTVGDGDRCVGGHRW